MTMEEESRYDDFFCQAKEHWTNTQPNWRHMFSIKGSLKTTPFLTFDQQHFKLTLKPKSRVVLTLERNLRILCLADFLHFVRGRK